MRTGGVTSWLVISQSVAPLTPAAATLRRSATRVTSPTFERGCLQFRFLIHYQSHNLVFSSTNIAHRRFSTPAMAFGGTGGFTFGSNNNNQQQSTGFGGFGTSNTNTGKSTPFHSLASSDWISSGGFGSNTTSTGFGSSTAQTNPFGGGGGGGAFGSTPNNGGTWQL